MTLKKSAVLQIGGALLGCTLSLTVKAAIGIYGGACFVLGLLLVLVGLALD